MVDFVTAMSASDGKQPSAAAAQATNVAPFMSNTPPPPKLDLAGNTAKNWRRFRMMWQNYEIASRCREESKEFRTATLLTCIGQEALEAYDGLAFDSAGR